MVIFLPFRTRQDIFFVCFYIKNACLTIQNIKWRGNPYLKHILTLVFYLHIRTTADAAVTLNLYGVEFLSYVRINARSHLSNLARAILSVLKPFCEMFCMCDDLKQGRLPLTFYILKICKSNHDIMKTKTSFSHKPRIQFISAFTHYLTNHFTYTEGVKH